MKSIAVVGLGQFGSQVAITLTQKGFSVVAVDESEESVMEIKDLVANAVILDATDEKAMRAVNVDGVDGAVVAIGSNVQSSLLATALLQRLGIEQIYVRAINQLQEGILRSMGIQQIVNIEEEMGKQLSNTLASGRIGRYIQISERHSLLELKVPKPLVKKTLKELNIRSQYQINIIGIKTLVPHVEDDGEVRYHTEMADVPDPDYPLGKDDILVVMGPDENVQKFLRLGEDDD